jgi:hypothetical protein
MLEDIIKVRNKLSMLCMVLVITQVGHLQAQPELKTCRLSITGSSGYFWQDFRWSIAGDANGKNPNILSELKWQNVRGPYLNLGLGWNVWKQFYVRSEVKYGTIISGTVTDTDYRYDNRTAPVFEMQFKSNKGSQLKYIAEIGYQLIDSDKIKLMCFAGFSQTTQLLYIIGEGVNKDLKSSYQNKRSGIIFTMNSSFRLNRKLSFMQGIDYLQFKYNAQANWNMIEAFKHPVSFEHKANGFEIQSTSGFQYRLREQISLSAQFSYSAFRTGHGNDKLFLRDNTTTNTQFNGAITNQLSIGGGINLKF